MPIRAAKDDRWFRLPHNTKVTACKQCHQPIAFVRRNNGALACLDVRSARERAGHSPIAQWHRCWQGGGHFTKD